MAESGADIRVRLAPEGVKEVVDALKRVRGEAAAAARSGAGGVDLFGASIGKLKALLPTIGFAAFVSSMGAFARSSINAAADLDDLAEKTGASVENLSKLAQQARISGTEFGIVEQALVRLAKGISGTDEEASGAARALQALGLRAEELRGKDTADALRIVAGRLAEFRDSAGKTAIAMELFGKSGAQVLPFLKDLINDGELAANVTAKQAAEAEELGKAWRRLANEARNLGMAISLGVVPWLRDMLERLQEARRIAGGLGEAIRLFFPVTGTHGLLGVFQIFAKGESPGERIRELSDEIARLQDVLDTPPRGFGAAMLDSARRQTTDQINDLKKKLEFAKFLQRQALRDLPNQDTPGERARFGLGGQLLEFEKQNAKERLAVEKARFDALLNLEAQYAGVVQRNRAQILASEKAIADALAKSAAVQRDIANAKLSPQERIDARRGEAVEVEGKLSLAATTGNVKEAIAAHEKLIALAKELKESGDQGADALFSRADDLLKLAQAAEKLKLTDEARKADEAAKRVRVQLAPIRAEIEKLEETLEPIRVKLRLAESEIERFSDQLAKEFVTVNVRPVIGAASGGPIPGLARGGRVPGWSPGPTADNVLMWGTAGEFMQPVRAVEYYGTDFMEAIRKMELPRFAEGGLMGAEPGGVGAGGDVQVLDIRIGGRRTGRFTGSREDIRALAQGLEALQVAMAGDG